MTLVLSISHSLIFLINLLIFYILSKIIVQNRMSTTARSRDCLLSPKPLSPLSSLLRLFLISIWDYSLVFDVYVKAVSNERKLSTSMETFEGVRSRTAGRAIQQFSNNTCRLKKRSRQARASPYGPWFFFLLDKWPDISLLSNPSSLFVPNLVLLIAFSSGSPYGSHEWWGRKDLSSLFGGDELVWPAAEALQVWLGDVCGVGII